MIDKYSRPQCYNAFYSTKSRKMESANSRIKVSSAIGAGIGALGAAYAIAKHQSRLFNKSINMFSIKYTEPEIFGVAISSVAGGFTLGALTDDKKYFKAKTHEAIHQVVANIVAPLATISLANKLFDKFEPKIKLPQIQTTNKLLNGINCIMKSVPRLFVACIGLVAGLYAGTKISNIINGTDKTQQARKIKALDYIYHPDDFATAVVLADKNGVVQRLVSKIIPPVFMMHGYEAGTKR